MAFRSKPLVLAVVPARAGSKRLPGKNLSALGGRPLLQWTLDAAIASASLSKVVVSSDNPAALELAARVAGVSCRQRAPALATDSASSVDVVLDVLDHEMAEGRSYEAVLLLQPTSPLRSASDIEGALQLFFRSNGRAVVSVCKAEHPPHWFGQINGEGRLVGIPQESLRRSQELPESYRINGALYVIAPTELRSGRSFFPGDVMAFVMPRKRSVDVDTAIDLSLCEALLKAEWTD